MRRSSVLIATLLFAIGGCGGSPAPGDGSAGTPSASPSSATDKGTARTFTDWPTYHRTPGRLGRATASVSDPLAPAWSQELKGAVYGEPLMAGGHLLVATEADILYSLDPASGDIAWHRRFGRPMPLSALPCGDIDPLGITGTPVYDRRTGLVFLVAETTGGKHTLWAVDAASGAKRWHRSLDTQRRRNRKAEQERSALLLVHGRVVTTFGGLAGDCDNYVGYVTSVATSGKGKIHSYAVPTPREAGMWSPAGPVEGANGDVYVASGNGEKAHGRWDKSDSVTELTPVTLRRESVFAPATWKADNAADLDLGSSSPINVSHRVVIAGKRGTVYLLRPHLGGVGSAVDKLGGCTAFGGAAVVDAHTVLMPCLGQNSIRELHVTRHHLRWGWTASGLYASPVIAGQRVYVADRDSGDLHVLQLSDGTSIQSLHAGSLTHFPSVTISGGMVFVPTLDGITAFAD